MSIPPARAQPKVRWDLLAGLRFLLAWIVACSHINGYFQDTDRLTRATADFGGKAAVLGFFLVSGYSIAASLQRDPQAFYWRRCARIYPMYIATLIIGMIVQQAAGGNTQMPIGPLVTGANWLTALGNVLLLQTFLVKPVGFAGPVWSLAVEVSYYAVAPLLLRLPKWFPLLVITGSALSYAAPRYDEIGPVYYLLTRFNMLVYAWAWFMGYYLFAHRKPQIFLLFALLGSVLISLNTFLNPEPYAPATFIGSLLVIYAAGSGRLSRMTSHVPIRVLNFLGGISYPLYLLQYPIFIAAWTFAGIANGYRLLGLCLLGAVLGYILIDVYLRRGWLYIVRRRSAVALQREYGI